MLKWTFSPPNESEMSNDIVPKKNITCLRNILVITIKLAPREIEMTLMRMAFMMTNSEALCFKWGAVIVFILQLKPTDKIQSINQSN